MSQNQTTRYLKYAIGEIILVVIGILIALQINNWNEHRKENKKLHSILLQIKSDLTTDLEVVNNTTQSYKRKDSIIKLILDQHIEPSTFSRIGGSFAPFSSIVLDLNTSGYEQLQANIDQVPENYKPLIRLLNTIYIDIKSNLDLYNDIMDESVEGRFKLLAESQPWFADWSRNIPSVEADHYFMTDSISLNRTSLYLSSLEATADEGFRLKLRAIDAMILIDSITGNNTGLPANALIDLEDEIIKKGLEGTYTLTQNTDRSEQINDSVVRIRQKGSSLYMSSASIPESKLYWNHGLSFLCPYGIVSFKKLDNNSIQLHIQRKSGDIFMQKNSQ